MPEPEDENGVGVAIQFVNDPIGAANDLSNSRIVLFRNDSPNFKLRSYEQRLINELVAKGVGAFWIIVHDKSDRSYCDCGAKITGQRPIVPS